MRATNSGQPTAGVGLELDAIAAVVIGGTSLFGGKGSVVGAVVAYLLSPTRAAQPLATVRQFMAENNATILMVILAILGVKLIGDAIAGVWA